MSTAAGNPAGAAPRTRPSSRSRPSRAAGFLGTPSGQIATAVLILLAIVSAFVDSGALGGTPIAEAAGGWLSADGTWIAPAGPAFSIWSIIYAGLVAYAIWQFFPTSATARHGAARRRSVWSAVAGVDRTLGRADPAGRRPGVVPGLGHRGDPGQCGGLDGLAGLDR